MIRPINITIADDHQIFRKGLVHLLRQKKMIGWIDQASTGHDLMDKIGEREPDIAFVDIEMPDMDGFEVTKKIKDHYPKIKVVILTVHQEEIYIQKMLDLKVNAYLTKSSSKEDVLRAVKTLCTNEYFHTTATSNAMRNMLNKNLKIKNIPIPKQLKPIEVAIVKGISQGQSAEEIASDVCLAKRTVDTYRSGLLKATGVKSSAELVLWAVNHGYL